MQIDPERCKRMARFGGKATGDKSDAAKEKVDDDDSEPIK